ncbi:hypothetical protein KIPB_012692, partial [Kipferlia bialata]
VVPPVLQDSTVPVPVNPARVGLPSMATQVIDTTTRVVDRAQSSMSESDLSNQPYNLSPRGPQPRQ